MEFVRVERSEALAKVTYCRGKVNAFNRQGVIELREVIGKLRADPDVRAVVLQGSGAFFSFGFDVPLLYSLTEQEFTEFLHDFTALYLDLFEFPKPLIGALNGHAVAGGCMMALGCDWRIMQVGRAKISLNEITFGSGLLAGSVEMLRFWIGSRRAEEFIFSGAMLDADAALALGLIDSVVSVEEFDSQVAARAHELAQKDTAAYANIKRLSRASTCEVIRRHEKTRIDEFVRIWYSPSTRKQLERIVIR